MKRNGFTLIEMVVSMVVMAVLFLAIAGFVELGARGYVDTAERQRLQNQARFAIEKMTREIGHAVPNSIATRRANQCVRFYPIKASGFYHEQVDPDDLSKTELQFIVGNSGFELADFANERHFMVINPSRISDLETGDAANSATTSLSQRLNMQNVLLDDEGYFAVDLYALGSRSIANRHYIYSADNRVEYCIDNGFLIRTVYSIIDDTQLDTAVVAQYLSPASRGFFFSDSPLQRGGLVQIDLTFALQDESSVYTHDVQVMNVQ